uniref:Transmembrane protein n=1 Tax=Chromera velia CCMP2878 TaxID=1169474 RepID=A0A0G4HSN3_9ALVE|eukprot:Cvel_8324.t1-p1 / transcript=Cvel_8324.t1 / gene=Cvel_8324 / organism=Chromera_velia_CCMP2878 / gene_product=hypothetical protein / transcript_product=hypothetical protein / location=Cvel_scaffold457:76684-78825(+) / protein_length=350 / sequence_SO=supercontig / SO=protein_coding / is_pseudo=false
MPADSSWRLRTSDPREVAGEEGEATAPFSSLPSVGLPSSSVEDSEEESFNSHMPEDERWRWGLTPPADGPPRTKIHGQDEDSVFSLKTRQATTVPLDSHAEADVSTVKGERGGSADAESRLDGAVMLTTSEDGEVRGQKDEAPRPVQQQSIFGGGKPKKPMMKVTMVAIAAVITVGLVVLGLSLAYKATQWYKERRSFRFAYRFGSRGGAQGGEEDGASVGSDFTAAPLDLEKDKERGASERRVELYAVDEPERERERRTAENPEGEGGKRETVSDEKTGEEGEGERRRDGDENARGVTGVVASARVDLHSGGRLSERREGARTESREGGGRKWRTAVSFSESHLPSPCQ